MVEAHFDPEAIADKATCENPYQCALGVQYVIVNGKLVIDSPSTPEPDRERFSTGRGRETDPNAVLFILAVLLDLR